MIKRTHRRAAALAGVALSLGLSAPAMANVIVGTPNTFLNVDPGGVTAILNVAGVSTDLAPTTTYGLGLASAVNTLGLTDLFAVNTLGVTDLSFVNTTVVTDAFVANAIAAPYAFAGLGIASDLESDASDYLNMNSAPDIIAAIGTLF